MSNKILLRAGGVVILSVVIWGSYYFHKVRREEVLSFSSLEVIPTGSPQISIPTEAPQKGVPFLINGARRCASRTPFLVLLIPSMPGDVANREAIRRTWGDESLMPGVDIMRMFLIGVSNPPSNSSAMQSAILSESATSGDIIQQDFLDTYNNLTTKTLMGMEWVAKHCPRASYVMKIDSDMFLNPVYLVNQLLQPHLPAKKDYFTGYVVQGARPFRNKDTKWYVSTEVYSRDVYPPYCSGTGYVFSGDLATKVYHVAAFLKPIHMEDVFVGLCLEKLGVTITDPPNSVFIGERLKYESCKFAKLITVHHYTKEELVGLWPDFMESVKRC